MTAFCPACGFEFPPPDRRVTTRPEQTSVLAVETDWIEVEGVSFQRHEKEGSPPSLRVTYKAGLTVHREWICFEHSGYARTKAESWWMRRGPTPVPKSVGEALARQHQLAVPSHIRVKPSGRYHEITAFRFDPSRLAA